MGVATSPHHGAGDDARISATAIGLAQARLAALQSSVQQIELVAAGLMSFEAALAAAVVAAGKSDLGGSWSAPLWGLGVSMVADLITIFAGRRASPWGESPARFYSEHGGEPEAVANAQILSDLDKALSTAAARAADKRLTNTIALVFFIVTVVYSLFVLIRL